MYRKHTAFTLPEDSNTVLWRYLSFPKLISLISQKRLFFPSIATLKTSDLYEGYLAVPIENSESQSNGVRAGMNELFNELTAVSCWYMSDEESAAMWKLYDDTIAIKTTIGSLIDCLQGFKEQDSQGKLTDVDFHVGKVTYLETSAYNPPSDSAYYPVLHKRSSYSHERELRVVCNIWTGPHFDTEEAILPYYLGSEQSFPNLEAEFRKSGGILFPIDVNKLIDEVIVSPRLDSWVFETVQSVVKVYGFQKQVRQSLLNTIS